MGESGAAAGGGLLIRYGNFIFRRRNLLFPAAMVMLLAAFRPVYPAGDAAMDLGLDLAGLAVILAAQGLRAAVIGLAYIKRGGLNKRIYAEELVTDGLFAHCRNPLYVANLLMLLGYFLIHNNPGVYLIGGAFFLFSYAAMVAAEEAYLRRKCGAAFDDYCRAVGRWGINPRGLVATFRGMTFNWRRVIIKDYSTATTWMFTVLALLAYQTVVRRGVEEGRTTLILIALGMVAVGLAGLTVRALKKARLLVDRAPAGAGERPRAG